MRGHGYTLEETRNHIEGRIQGFERRRIRDREWVPFLHRIFNQSQGLRYKKIPPAQWRRIRPIIAEGITAAELRRKSPFRADQMSPEAIVDILFPGDPLIACAIDPVRSFATKSKSQWYGQLGMQQYITAQPMRAKYGRTEEGRLSQHCKDNLGPQRFAVVEFDLENLAHEYDRQSRLLWYLGGIADLVLVLWSGNKSFHGGSMSRANRPRR